MNKVYRNVWNEHTQTWVAASELANSKTKSNTVCELPLVKRILNMFGLKKIVSLTLTTLVLQLQAISPVYAANLAITGGSNLSTNSPAVAYGNGSHGSIVLAGDDDFCGTDKVSGRRNITGGISAMEEYLRFAENRSFNGRNPYGVSNGQQVWTGDGTTGGINTGSSGYMGTPTGGDINRLPVAYGVYSFASGCGSYATGNYSTAFGNNATATAGGAQAFGVAALASGATAVAIGVGAQATNTASLALGSVATSDGAGSVAVGFNSAAQKDNATALGANAMATVEKAVALGSDSLANTSSGIQGYDPAGTNTDAVNQSATWKSTAGAVAIGNTNMQITRQITGLAAGTADTDAVNVAQLKNLASSTSTGLSSLSTAIIRATDLTSINNSINTLQKDALQWNGTAYDASHGTANAQKIIKVAAGDVSENSTDAVNAGQLFSLSSSTSTSVESLSTTLRNAGDLSNVNNSISSLNNTVSNLQKDALQWNGTAYDASHGTANAQKIVKVAAGDVTANSTDAVNAGQLFSLSSSTSTSVESLSTTLRNAGDLSNVNNSINSLSSSLNTANSSISSLNNNVSNLQKDALQWNGTAYDASHGTANAQKIIKVAAGDVSENSTDAVNAGQLFSLSSSTSTSLDSLSTTLHNAGDLSNVNNSINSLSSSLNTANSSISSLNNNVSNLQKDALQWNGTAYDASHGTANAQKIVKVAAGDVSENSTDAVNAGQLFSLSSSTSTSLDSLSTTLRNAGDLSNVNNSISSLNNTVSNLQKDALQWNGTAYDASHGTANAQKIVKVAAGDVTANSTDAVNGGQLYSLSSSTVTGLDNLSTAFSGNLSTGLSTANSRIDTVSQSTANLAGDLTTAVNSISTLQKDALQWNGTAYDASHGTANAQKIVKVAAGDVSENSTDAVNAGQLFSLSSSTSTSLDSLSTTLHNAGDLSNVNNNINTLQKDALQWNGTAYDASHGTANAQKIVKVAAGDVSENSTDAVNAGQLFSLSSSTSTSLDSLSTTLHNAGDLSNVNNSISSLNNTVSNLQKDALQWNGTAYDASHGTANAQKIVKVAAGDVSENSTDAVNAGQLFSLSSSTSTSVESLSTTLRNAGDLSNVNNNINTLQKDALQWNGTAYDASHGTANAQKIVKVAAGDVTANSTDAVNGGQLYSLSSSTVTGLDNLSTAFSGNLSTGLSTANSRIDTVSQSTANLAGDFSTAVNSISTLQKDALQWNGTAYDASHGTANAQKIVKVAAGDVSENSTDAVNAGQLFSLSSSTSTSLDSLSTTLHNAGDLSNVNNSINSLSSSLNTANSSISSLNNNVSNLQKDALQWNGTAYDASHGTANAQKIVKVAAGDVTANSTDAVNGGQLYSLSSSTVTGLDNLSTAFSGNLSTGLSTANSRIDTVSQSTANLAGDLTTAVNSISTLQKDALQWNGTAYDASHGTANAQKIVKVAAGDVSENSTDAVNAGQLFSLSSSTSTSLDSLSTTLHNAGDLSNVNNSINSLSSSLNTANSSISSLNNNVSNLQKDALQWNGTAYDASHGTANAQKIVKVAAGDVTANSTDAVNGGQLYSLSSSTVTGLDNLSTAFSGNLSTGLSTANSRIDTVSQSTANLAGDLTTAVNSINSLSSSLNTANSSISSLNNNVSNLQKDALQWNGT
ncbi:ESPR-type extended signal peptide-containing protein, partial [Snodgrassella gandavensis]|uniref:ESPR-type extended signal peptide-containing protein n=1 Tax=Snodgrassella gandavensis TaxID=2946698 RepID=UPI0023B30389